MMKSRMTEGEKRKLRLNMNRRPKELAEALDACPPGVVIPYALTEFTLIPGTYGIATQRLDCMLFKRGNTLLRALLREDLVALQNRTIIPTRQAQTFFSQKYGQE